MDRCRNLGRINVNLEDMVDWNSFGRKLNNMIGHREANDTKLKDIGPTIEVGKYAVRRLNEVIHSRDLLETYIRNGDAYEIDECVYKVSELDGYGDIDIKVTAIVDYKSGNRGRVYAILNVMDGLLNDYYIYDFTNKKAIFVRAVKDESIFSSFDDWRDAVDDLSPVVDTDIVRVALEYRDHGIPPFNHYYVIVVITDTGMVLKGVRADRYEQEFVNELFGMGKVEGRRINELGISPIRDRIKSNVRDRIRSFRRKLF